jgi:DNA-binding NtrC family response regulator
MAEELANDLPFRELLAYYRIAESELTNSRGLEIQNRLGKCARLLLPTDWPLTPEQMGPLASESNRNGSKHSLAPNDSGNELASSTNAYLEEQVLNYEGQLIKQALEVSDGSVTRAARMLGVTHQGLAFILNGRHKNLLTARKPVKRRRRSIIRFH